MEVTNQNDQKKIAQRQANARRQREYRTRKRATMGDTAYLESVAKYKRDLRVRKNTTQPENPPLNSEVQTIEEPRKSFRSTTTKTDSKSIEPRKSLRSISTQTDSQPIDEEEPRRALRSKKVQNNKSWT